MKEQNMRDYVHIHQIQLPSWLFAKLKLETSKYVTRQETMETLIKTFDNIKMLYSIKEEGEKIIFLNESGEELVKIIRD